jgi:hypothetical protein
MEIFNREALVGRMGAVIRATPPQEKDATAAEHLLE